MTLKHSVREMKTTNKAGSRAAIGRGARRRALKRTQDLFRYATALVSPPPKLTVSEDEEMIKA